MGGRSSEALCNRRLAMRASVTLAVARVRFELTLARCVRLELARWEAEAQRIGDPAVRALALSKLREEGFNAKAAAMLATLAPRRHRSTVARAIVALEVLYDYLDGCSETVREADKHDGSLANPIEAGRELFAPLLAAVLPPPNCAQPPGANGADRRYVGGLTATISRQLEALPAADRIRGQLESALSRGAEAQIHAHAASRLGDGQLEGWARSQAVGSGLEWRCYLAGAAASVLSVHAMLTAAADPRLTTSEAIAIDRAYLPICALATLLDGVVDHDRDQASGERHYIRLYETPVALAASLTHLTRDAVLHTSTVARGRGNVMTLSGVVAYYATAPGAEGEFARPIIGGLRAQLGGLLTPALALMRRWRGSQQLRAASNDPARAATDQPAAGH
jgi:hypothetical protein